MNDHIGNDISSIEWLDDRIKNLHFFEKVVLGRAKNDSNFTEPEMVDMIGWAIAIDSIWDNTSTNFMFKDIEDISHHKHPHSENIIENVLLVESNTHNKRISESKKTKNKKRTKPSRRMINYLVNNVRLSYATLETFLKLAAEHITSLNVSSIDVKICLDQREYLRNTLKSCFDVAVGCNHNASYSIDDEIILKLINLLLKENLIIELLEKEKKVLCIDTYKKELLILAIVFDDFVAIKKFNAGTQVGHWWQTTTNLISTSISSPYMSYDDQANLLLWLDEVMFGASAVKLLDYSKNTPEAIKDTFKEDAFYLSRRATRNDFFSAVHTL